MKTKTVTAKNDITLIEQEFLLPIQWPLASDRLMLQLYDEDNVLDEIVGSMFFSLKKLCKEGENGGKFFWQNLYGAPLDYSGSIANAMNDNPELASAWKGRILMHVECHAADHPERIVRPLDEGIKNAIMELKLLEEREYDIIAEVGMGICLPEYSSEYKIMIKIGDFEMTTAGPKESKNGYNRWSERFNQSVMRTHY